MADITIEVVSSGKVWDFPGSPAPFCEDVVKSLAGGLLLDSKGRVVLHSRRLEAGKHYKFEPIHVPAGTQAANVPDVFFKIHSQRLHIEVSLPSTCSYSEICSRVEEEWPVYQAVAYHLSHLGRPLPEEEWSRFVQGLPATNQVKLSVMLLGKSFKDYAEIDEFEIRELLRRELGVQGSEMYLAAHEVDQAFPAYSLPPDDTMVAGGTTLGGLFHNLALNMVHNLTAMGDTRHSTEYTNRAYIAPVLVAAVTIVLAIRPDVSANSESLQMRTEYMVQGKMAWGHVDYAIFYRQFMVIATEVRASRFYNPAWAPLIMQIAAARDMLARQVERRKEEHIAGRKQNFWEISELKDVPTNAIMSNGNYWTLTRYIPSKDDKRAQLIMSRVYALSLIPAAHCTVSKVTPELRELVAHIVQMLLSHIDSVDKCGVPWVH